MIKYNWGNFTKKYLCEKCEKLEKNVEKNWKYIDKNYWNYKLKKFKNNLKNLKLTFKHFIFWIIRIKFINILLINII